MMNVRGLQNENKLAELFAYLKKMNYDIIMLQETYSKSIIEEKWQKQWNGKIIFLHFNAKARGTVILFNPKLEVEIDKITCCKNGQYVIADCTVQHKNILLVNVYAPNQDSPEYFMEVFEKAALHKHSDIIMAGDFNLVLDTQKDAVNRKCNNDKANKMISAFMREYMLIDVWREMHPSTFEFTWYKSKPKEVFARLDYILVNHGLTVDVVNVSHIPSYKSDHSAVCLQINLAGDFKRGPGFWKLNETILENIDTLSELNKCVDQAKTRTKNYEKRLRWEAIKETLVKTSKNISDKIAKKRKMDVENINGKIMAAKRKLE